MTTDLSQTWKDFVRLEDAALQTFVQESGTLLNALGIHLPGLSPVTEPPSANRSDTGSPFGSKITVSPRQGPAIGDPPISAIEGTEWNGILATISDSDGDGSYGQPETVSGTIDWGDGNSSPFNLSVPEDGTTAYLSNGHTWMETGTYTVTVSASDPDGGQSQASDTATVADGALSWQENPPNEWNQQFNGGPTLFAPNAQTNTEGDYVYLPVQATDGDGDTLSYDAQDLPPGLSINSSTGLISGTVAYGAATEFGGSYNPTIIVDDGQDGSTQTSFYWTINPAQVDPVLTTPSNQTNLRGDTVSLQVNASQTQGDALSYYASNLPPGLSIDSGSGLITGTVDGSATLGVPYPVTVTAADNVTNLYTNETFNWTINATNAAPVLTSPGNQVNSAGDQVSVQLTASDADGDALTYTAAGLPPGLAIDPISGIISGTLPNSAASSTPYNVSVNASDGNASNSQSFTWTVNAVSLQSPGDQSNLDGDNVSLQLTASDANNATISYSATGLPPGLTINTSSGLISGAISSTADTNSPYSVTVTAKDSNNDSVSQTFNWSVARVSLNPVNDQENQEGTSISLQLSATDNEATPTYSATGLPPGLSISSSGLISGTVGLGSFGISPYQVTVTATDGTATSNQSFVWTVTPRVALVNPGPQANATGDSVSLQLSATSPGGTMNYSASGLPAGLSINASTGLITGTPTTANSTLYMVTVTANDGTSSSSQTFAWTISAIKLVSPGDQTNNDGDTVSLSLTKSYHGSGMLSYSATGLPPNLSISAKTGVITGTISGTADTSSPYAVTVTLTDGTNTSSQTFNWTVNPVVSIDPIDDQSNAVGDSVSLQVPGSDAESKTLSYSETGLPSGLSINNSTGLISGTIAKGADTGSPYTVTVTANDSSGNSATQSFTWSVAHVLLVNPGPQSNLDGAVVSLQLQGHDGDGDTISYAASGLPSGLSINASTGKISGTIAANADANSPYVVTVTASDGTNSATQTFVWTVAQVVLTAPSNQTNTEGDTVSLQLQGSASSGSLAYNANGLPPGLTLSTTTGKITGTIAAGAAASGPYTVDVSVSNGTYSTGSSFTWTVNPVVNVTVPADQTNNEGNSVSLPISATDSLGKALTYTASGLPSGLSINSSTGLISGSISSGDAANSPYVVSVTASDGTYSSTIVFSWTVTHTDTTALTMTNPGTQVNVSGDSVNLQINASDPDGSDSLNYSATGLPDGLAIDPYFGFISGIVADDAFSTTPYSVTVTASDGNGQSINQTFPMVVNPPAILLTPSPISAVEGIDTGGITVATFTTPDLDAQASDFTATINWGDGSVDFGAVTGQNGIFTLTGDHTYAEKGTYAVTITITDSVTGGSGAASTTATVADAPLTLNGGFQLGDPWDDQPSSFIVAEFTDANPSAPLTDFSATINWGDGSPMISGPGYVQETPEGDFLVVASHTYPDPWNTPPDPASYTVSVTVTDVDGASASTTSTVVVSDIEAQKNSGMDWSFNDANPYATTNDFVVNGQKGMALVNWGDGTSSTVAVTGGPGNGSGLWPSPFRHRTFMPTVLTCRRRTTRSL